MTREEADKKKICVHCAHCLTETVEHKSWTEYKHYCTNNIVSVHPVTGDEVYNPCILTNNNGECEDFLEPKKTWWDKFLGK